MVEFLNGLRRTNMCTELSVADEGKQVVVMGFVQKTRNLGNLLFIDLRDRTGLLQIAFDQSKNPELFDKAYSVKSEYVLAVKGTVQLRIGKNINPNMKTGGIEILASEVKILSEAELPPFFIADGVETNEALRLKYRYLDLRRPSLQKLLMVRNSICRAAREYLGDNGFLEIETPFLGKSTPEGARDYLVPSRIHEGCFYALPQSPQLYKQLLMISGFDRYYQIARCFRDEDLRANRQPEFTQIDLEMSYVEEDEQVMEVAEGLIRNIFKKVKGIDIGEKLRRMTWKEAMDRFGSDKPDTRFGYEIKELSDIVKDCGFGVFANAVKNKGYVRGICIDGGADKFTRKEIDALGEFVKDYGAKGLAWASLKEQPTSSFYKFLTSEEIANIQNRIGAKQGDLILIVADTSYKHVCESLGALRNFIAKKLDVIPDKFDLLWIVDFPLLEYSEEDGRYYAMHHPFTMPNLEDYPMLDNPDKLGEARALAYDLVINGQEAGGGSIRIHDPEMQRRMFKLLGMSEEVVKYKFGFFVDAFRYGAPPHGGLAFGLDRLTMLLGGTDNIKDVIAFPKVQNASCLMTGAPDFVENKQLEELSLNIKK